MHKDNKYDFTAIGQAIKQARPKQGWTRERLAQEVDLAPRYIMSIENKGQHQSFQVFVELMTLFNISVDQFLFPDSESEKSTRHRQLDAELADEINQDRATHGKKPLRDKDDDDDEPPSKNVKRSKTDPDCGLREARLHIRCEWSSGKRTSMMFDDLYKQVIDAFPELEALGLDSGYRTPWIVKSA